MTINAKELRNGVTLLDEILEKGDEQEVVVTVRGKPKYVVMPIEKYTQLRELELEAALIEARRDLSSGNVKEVTVDEHIQEVAGEQ